MFFNKKQFLVFFSILFCASGVFAQYQELLHKTYREKTSGLHHIYVEITQNNCDSLYVEDYTTNMKQWALSKNDKSLALEADLLKAFYYCYSSENVPKSDKHAKSLQYLASIIEKAKKESLPFIEARGVYMMAKTYWWCQEYEKSFQWLFRSSQLLNKMVPEDFLFMADHLNYIGQCYYFFGDYENALLYYKKSSKLKKNDFNADAILNAQNTLGLCFRKMGQLSRAKKWFLKVINDTTQYCMPVWKGIASGNLGFTYYLEGNYKKAIPLFKRDIQGALRIGDYGLAAGSVIPLADVYLKQGQLDKAGQKIEEAARYIQLSGDTDRLRNLYVVKSKWFAAKLLPDSSAAYFDLTLEAREKYKQKYDRIKIMRADQRLKAKEREMEQGKIKATVNLKLQQRNFLIVLILALLVMSILAYFLRNKYLLKEKQIRELVLENTQKALVNAKTKLEHLTQKVRNDTSLIFELQKREKTADNQNLLDELHSKNILTQEDWIHYQELFNQVYPKFLNRLKSDHPELSQAEIRYLCLLKHGFSNHEMALTLGVSPNAIRVTKHRLRKKLNLNPSTNLDSFVREMGKVA